MEKNPNGPFMAYGGYESTVKIHRKEIDAITGPDRQFFIMAATGHGGWANTKAVELAGVSRDKEPIDFFGKDPDSTQVLHCSNQRITFHEPGAPPRRPNPLNKNETTI